MKKTALITMAILLIASLAFADSKDRVIGDETLSGVTTASVSTLTVPEKATSGLVAIYGDTVRWKGYTSDPTSTNGALLYNGDYVYFDSLVKFKVILKSGGSDSTVYVMYYGRP